MKLTKKLEAEIAEVMNTYWDSYVQGDLKTWASFLPKDYRNIGTTQEEIWNNKDEIVDYTLDIIEQMVGMAEFRNKEMQIIPYDPYFMVQELGDLYVKVEGNWSFYAKFRLSSLLKKSPKGWKIFHQHGSYPDSKTQEGEAFAFDTLKAENVKLQKAVKSRTKELEQKNRELQIEAALERVRARAMAMHHSDELSDLIGLIYRELTALDLMLDRCFIMLFDKAGGATWWMASDESPGGQKGYYIKYHKHKPHLAYLNGFRDGEGKWSYTLTGKEKKDWDDFIFSETDLKKFPPVVIENMKSVVTAFLAASFNKYGCLTTGTFSPLASSSFAILTRFSQMFEQTYTRFLDLQKAEAQAREAQIEAALERVRSASMAMHKSEELQGVVNTISSRFNELAFDVATSNILVFKEDLKKIEYWAASNTSINYHDNFFVPFSQNPYTKGILKAKESNRNLFSMSLSKKEKNELFRYLFKETDFRGIPLDRQSFIMESEAAEIVVALDGNIGIQIIRYLSKPFSEQEISILYRFAKVFNQTYTRFLDLQKAEAQARESQIEAALEKVRSRSLAMHKSDELQEVIKVVLERLSALGITLDAANINTPAKDRKSFNVWLAAQTHEYAHSFLVPWNLESTIGRELIESYESFNDYFANSYSKEDKDAYFRELYERSDLKHIPDERKTFVLQSPAYGISSAGTRNSMIQVISYSGKTLSLEEANVLKRFAHVFEQCYIRFQDLEKAEAQAREAQVEASLERVRSRTMAMHKSEELSAATMVLFEEFKKLQIENDPTILNRGFISTIDEANACFDLWATEIDGTEITRVFKIGVDEITTGKPMYAAWRAKSPYLISDLQGEQLDLWLEYLKSIGFKVAPGIYGTRRVNNFIFYSKGFLGITSSAPLSEDSIQIMIRLTKVFEQTYTRFLDLQKAEAQARESQVQLALERVRARTMAMQHSDELAETSFLLDSQVRALGIKTRGCAFNIYGENDSTEWFSSELGAMPAYKTPRENVFLRYYQAGKNGAQIHIEEFEGDDCKTHYDYLCTLPVTGDSLREMIEAGGSFPTQQIDHVVYFKYGYLLFITLEPAFEAHEIFIRFANVFEQTYTRFLDLKKVEAQALRAEQDLIEIKEARKKAEDTLVELQLTQKQLIQSEKMASLGELTAGIAHEIQNPLNFVNNFSEVSTELVDEMNIEIEKGNSDEAKLIALDLKQNLEKINHHGKRAGDIVKSMLQHSRSSSGVKEPTDINALADEYLRLAYHGLRAKDKTFNATMKTDFDEAIGNIHVIPQDIGRVILNLITNAFYVVNEKQKSGVENYEPTVTVSTHRSLSSGEGRGEVILKVNDNGNGIPENIKEKIFQPFFTTKPTGQGTGLGLSLSYDILKAHGGELKVETKEGDGSSFTINLPIT